MAEEITYYLDDKTGLWKKEKGSEFFFSRKELTWIKSRIVFILPAWDYNNAISAEKANEVLNTFLSAGKQEDEIIPRRYFSNDNDIVFAVDILGNEYYVNPDKSLKAAPKGTVDPLWGGISEEDAGISSSRRLMDRKHYIAFFAALCLFLSGIEYAIPKPLPFLRLGLANLPVILSLFVMKRRDTLWLILLKILGQGIITGTLFSYVFLFSAAGSFASGLTMLALYPLCKKSLSLVGLSLTGALANNLAQLAMARLILFGTNTRYIAPLLLITGLVTGLLLGLFTEYFCRKSRWFAQILAEKSLQAAV